MRPPADADQEIGPDGVSHYYRRCLDIADQWWAVKDARQAIIHGAGLGGSTPQEAVREIGRGLTNNPEATFAPLNFSRGISSPVSLLYTQEATQPGASAEAARQAGADLAYDLSQSGMLASTSNPPEQGAIEDAVRSAAAAQVVVDQTPEAQREVGEHLPPAVDNAFQFDAGAYLQHNTPMPSAPPVRLSPQRVVSTPFVAAPGSPQGIAPAYDATPLHPATSEPLLLPQFYEPRTPTPSSVALVMPPYVNDVMWREPTLEIAGIVPAPSTPPRPAADSMIPSYPNGLMSGPVTPASPAVQLATLPIALEETTMRMAAMRSGGAPSPSLDESSSFDLSSSSTSSGFPSSSPTTSSTTSPPSSSLPVSPYSTPTLSPFAISPESSPQQQEVIQAVDLISTPYPQMAHNSAIGEFLSLQDMIPSAVSTEDILNVSTMLINIDAIHQSTATRLRSLLPQVRTVTMGWEYARRFTASERDDKTALLQAYYFAANSYMLYIGMISADPKNLRQAKPNQPLTALVTCMLLRHAQQQRGRNLPCYNGIDRLLGIASKNLLSHLAIDPVTDDAINRAVMEQFNGLEYDKDGKHVHFRLTQGAILALTPSPQADLIVNALYDMPGMLKVARESQRASSAEADPVFVEACKMILMMGVWATVIKFALGDNVVQPTTEISWHVTDFEQRQFVIAQPSHRGTLWHNPFTRLQEQDLAEVFAATVVPHSPLSEAVADATPRPVETGREEVNAAVKSSVVEVLQMIYDVALQSMDPQERDRLLRAHTNDTYFPLRLAYLTTTEQGKELGGILASNLRKQLPRRREKARGRVREYVALLSLSGINDRRYEAEMELAAAVIDRLVVGKTQQDQNTKVDMMTRVGEKILERHTQFGIMANTALPKHLASFRFEPRKRARPRSPDATDEEAEAEEEEEEAEDAAAAVRGAVPVTENPLGQDVTQTAPVEVAVENTEGQVQVVRGVRSPGAAGESNAPPGTIVPPSTSPLAAVVEAIETGGQSLNQAVRNTIHPSDIAAAANLVVTAELMERDRIAHTDEGEATIAAVETAKLAREAGEMQDAAPTEREGEKLVDTTARGLTSATDKRVFKAAADNAPPQGNLSGAVVAIDEVMRAAQRRERKHRPVGGPPLDAHLVEVFNTASAYIKNHPHDVRDAYIAASKIPNTQTNRVYQMLVDINTFTPTDENVKRIHLYGAAMGDMIWRTVSDIMPYLAEKNIQPAES
jgi:hypothetical protein